MKFSETNPHFLRQISFNRFILSALLMVALAGCSRSSEPVTPDKIDEPSTQIDLDQTIDPATSVPISYRMFFDSSANQDENVLQIRIFTGQLNIANLEEIFGDLNNLPLDDSGNKLGGPVLAEGLLWTLLASPSLDTINIVAQGANGLINSAFDLDGDGVADIVDIQIADGRRFSFVTEGLGMALFEQMLEGIDPWCDNNAGISLSGIGKGFGCDNDEGDSGVGGAGLPSTGGLINPFDLMCQQYETGNSARVLSRGATRSVERVRSGSLYNSATQYDTEQGHFRNEHTTTVFENNLGEHTRTLVTTTTYVTFSGEEERIARIDVDTINADGQGQRTRLDYDSSGEVALQTIRDIEAPLDDKDRFKWEDVEITSGDGTDSGTTGEGESSSDTEGIEAVIPVEVPVPDSNPGPEGDDSAIADFCNRRGTVESGIEQAASVDLGAFKVSCGDLVGNASNTDDCIIIDWAGPGDFQGVLNAGNDDGCGELEEPDENGNCQGTTAMQRLQGLTAAVAMATLNGVDICPDLSCRDFDSTITIGEIEAREEISESDVSEEDFATATPESDLSAIALQNASCRKGADAAFDVVNFLYKEQSALLLGRIADSTWYYLDLPDNLGRCWVFAANLTLSGAVEKLPFLIPPELPVPDSSGGNTSPPTAPSNLSYLCKPGFFEFTLSWNDNSDNEDGFKILKDGLQVGSVAANVKSFSYDPGGSNVFTYSVQSYNSKGTASAGINGVGCLP